MSPSPPPRLNVLGVGISATDIGEATEAILAAARAARPLGVSALAVHAVMEAQGDPDYRARLNSLDIAAPDGQPVRWALNTLHGAALRERVYGPFLMRSVCAAAALEGIPVFLFGTTPQTLDRLSAGLRAAHAGLRVAGAQASRFRRASEAEARQDARAISESGARIVFCGLGCPRQEAWVHAMRPLVGAPLVGVGAAFPLWAGERAMAPAWMQDSGLEWLYRLGQEPGRLAGRYLVQGPGFFAGVALQKLGRRQPDIAPRPATPDYWG
jgi:N-acetylglucosaminyldiphosphoundecaprenol N-acetyl-beta-D-mannosaminyltransferase